MFQYKIIDSHCDTLNLILNGTVDIERSYNHISLEKFRRGKMGIQFFAAWIDPSDKTQSYFKHGLKLIDSYQNMLSKYVQELVPILTYDDAIKAMSSSKVGCLLTIEGGDILEGDLDNLSQLYKLGVRLMTLTWNNT